MILSTRIRARRALGPALALALAPAIVQPLWAAPGPAASAAPAAQAQAAGAAAARASASAVNSALARPALPMGHGSAGPVASGAPAGASAALPPGHPPSGGAPAGGTMPPGHPGGGAPQGGGEGGRPMPPRPPQSNVKPDPSLPPRTIVVDVVDGATQQPMPGVEVALAITQRSIAKGDSKDQRRGRSDAAGATVFDKLEGPTATEFRATVLREGATFASPPFQLVQGQSMRATLYVFPVARSLRDTALLTRGFAYVEILDDVLQIEESFAILNLGTTAWQAEGVKVQLPPGAKAFKDSGGDLVWTSASDSASLRGTVTPGQHETSIRYQIPWNGERDLSFEIGLLPQVQSFRVASDAPPGLQLSAEGFSEPEPTQNNNGQRVLVVDRSLQRPDPNFRAAKVRLGNLPVRPVGRWYAVALAAVALVGGLYAASRLRATRLMSGGIPDDERVELEEAKERLLDELAALERAHKAGDVGPKTYERFRRNLTDALARLLTRLEPAEIETAPYRGQADRRPG